MKLIHPFRNIKTERRYLDGIERKAFKKCLSGKKLCVFSTYLDCFRNLCRQDDGVPKKEE